MLNRQHFAPLEKYFSEQELVKDSVTEKFSVTAADRKNYRTQCYNLDAIIAVGYRVNSKKATRFRQWATKTLKEYIQKGFVLNNELMKMAVPSGGITSMNCSNASGKSVPVNGEPIRKSQTFSISAATTTTRTAKRQGRSMPSYRTSCISR